MGWIVYDKTGEIKRCTIKELEYNGSFMGERTISCSFESPIVINFAIGDYLTYRGEVFYLYYTPSQTKSASSGSAQDAFEYDLVFNTVDVELQNCQLLDYVPYGNDYHYQPSPSFSFVGTVKTFAERIQANMNRDYPGWTIDVYEGVETEEAEIQIDNTSCWNALVMINKEFGLNFLVTKRRVRIGYPEDSLNHTFYYGKDNGLYQITRDVNADEAIVTRLYAYGGERNIPSDYNKRESDFSGKRNLMLPGYLETGKSYIESKNISAYGVREYTQLFEDIYPSIAGVELPGIGRIDELVSAEQITEETETSGSFKVTIKNIGFNIKDNLTSETATISMRSGNLIGYEFEIVEVIQLENGNYEITLNKSTRDNFQVPNAGQNLSTGDRFILLNITMPDKYVKYAEDKLLNAATSYLAEHDHVTYTYDIGVDEIYMVRNGNLHDLIREGMRLPLYDANLGIDYDIIIQGLQIKEGGDIPAYSISLSDKPIAGTIDKIWDAIDNVRGNGLSVLGGSSIGNGNITEVLNRKYLRKDVNDTAKGDIRFEREIGSSDFINGWEGKGWNIQNDGDAVFNSSVIRNELLSNTISSRQFASGPFGTGYILKNDPKTGKSYIEADEIYIRLKAYFDTLEIKHLAHVGGRIVLSPASMECIKVEEVSAENEKVYDSTGEQVYDSLNDEVLAPKSGGEKAYRCYFKQTDGEREIVNEFAVDDLAQCREFNVKTGTSHNVSNQYYWRRVLYVGEDYIDLSITDRDTGSMAPKAGDTIVTVGNKTNKSRQNVVFFSSYDEDAPCVKLYSGVDSYSMLNKEVTAISPNAGKNVFTGKMIIKPGSTGFGNLADAPNMDEINGAIADAKDAAENAKDAAEGVQESMSDLKGYVDGAFSDGIVSETEAKAIEKYLNIVNSEKLSAESVFNKLYANPYLEGSAKVSLSNARSSLLSSITALSGSIETAIGDGKATMAEKRDVDTRYADFNARLSAFRAAVETANKSIQDKLKSYSDNAQKAADEANNTASSAMEDANEARQSVSDLNKYVDGAFSDGIISGAEAKAIEKYLNTVSQSRKEMDATYTSLYVNPFLSGAPKSALYAAKNSLNTATTNLTAAIQSAISDGKTTVTEKEIVDSKFSAFNNACASLATAIENANKAIQQKIKEEAVSESRSEASSEIGKVSQADRDNIARMLGYKDYEELVYYAERGMTLINGGTINTSLVNAELMITSALIANAIKTNTLNVNDRFKIYTDGSVEMSGILHSLGRDTELVVSDGYVRIMYKGDDVAKLSVNENTGMPELSLYNGSRSCIVTAEKIMLSTGTGNTSFLTMDASVLGYGTIKKKTDGTLYLANNEYEMITVGISASPTYGGTTIPSPSPMHMVMRGESETVEAVPAEGYEFDRWSDGGSRKHTVTWSSAGQSLVAYFTRIQVTRYTLSLSASPSSGGSISGSGGYDAGSKATVSCAAASGWRFVRWSDGGYQTHSVTMDGNKSLTAYFERYTVTGDEIFSGVALTSGSYWNAYGNASVVSVGGGTASVRFNGWSGESNYVMFDRGYMGGKLEQGHKYRMTLSMKASISSASLIGFIGSSFADYVSEDVLFYGSYNGGELSTSYKILTAEFTARRDSTASDGFIFVTAEGCTVSVNSISLKEV
jgi:hypothetical protein